MKAFFRAYGRAVHFCTRQADAGDICELHQNQGPRHARGQYQVWLDSSKKCRLSNAAFQVTLDEVARTNPRAKQAKPQQFFDNSLVQVLVDEGSLQSCGDGIRSGE